MSEQSCIFCLKSHTNSIPFCPDNPGHGCTYGFHHEFPEDIKTTEKPKQPKKIDKQVCTKCGLHARNPVSAGAPCQHEYPS